MPKKVVFSAVVIDEENLLKLKRAFLVHDYEIVCVITHYDWMPIVRKVLPGVELHWLDNFLSPEKWTYPLNPEAINCVFEPHSAMPLALAEREDGQYGALEAETRLLFQASLAEDILNRHNPNFFVSWYSVERSLDYSLLKICKSRSIPVLMTKSAGFKRLIACTTDFASPILNKDFSPNESIIGFNNLKEDEIIYPFINKVLATMRNRSFNLFQAHEVKKGFVQISEPDFSKSKFLWQNLKTKGIIETLRTISSQGFFKNDSYYKRYLFQRYNEKKKKFIPKSDEKYIYFPLHLQPELTTMPIGLEFVNQIRAIKMLSDATGDDFVILVKEHPATFSAKATINRRFKNTYLYNWLTIIPKVQILPMDTNSNLLIDNSFAIASINGSVASEAFIEKKPIIVFSNMHLVNAPRVFRVSNTLEIKNAIQEIQTGSFDDNDYDKFVENVCKQTSCISRDFDGEVIYNDRIIPEITNILIRGFGKYIEKLSVDSKPIGK